ncbi:MAG: helix-turn-helix transcriptional regulator [Bryobacteraceae bacterium]
MLAPTGGTLIGQPIARFLPELENALQPGGEARFRASVQCEVHRSDGESFVAEVWFSTYKQTGTPKLAAIVADVTEELPAGLPSYSVESNGAKRPALSNRQIAVLRLVFEGLSNHEIASRLDMTSSAVKNTLQQLFSKAGVNNRGQMVRVALEQYPDLL